LNKFTQINDIIITQNVIAQISLNKVILKLNQTL